MQKLFNQAPQSRRGQRNSQNDKMEQELSKIQKEIEKMKNFYYNQQICSSRPLSQLLSPTLSSWFFFSFKWKKKKKNEKSKTKCILLFIRYGKFCLGFLIKLFWLLLALSVWRLNEKCSWSQSRSGIHFKIASFLLVPVADTHTNRHVHLIERWACDKITHTQTQRAIRCENQRRIRKLQNTRTHTQSQLERVGNTTILPPRQQLL